MRIKLDLTKSLERNAEFFFEKAKKAKKKIKGAEEALKKSIQELEKLEKQKSIQEKKQEQKPILRKKEWYEKFRWFFSSEGFLCIGGRDAVSNEIVIKKHTDKDDLIFHADIPGSPFFTIKTAGKEPGDATKQETAQAAASFSKAWAAGVSSAEIFEVKPEQVSKKTKAGEYMGKGAFMIYGKRKYYSPDIRLAVGIKQGGILSGPVNAIKKNAEKFVLIVPGREKTSAAAKKIKKKLKADDLDDIIRMLPAGGCHILK